MLVTPRPGVDRRNLLDNLRSVSSAVADLRGGGPQGAYKRLLSYLEWTSNAVRILSNQISSADLDRLVLTKGYERLLLGVGSMTGTEVEVQRVVNGLVSTELDQRVAAFEEAIKTLNDQMNRWSMLGEFVVPDSSFYIQHSEKLEDVDFASVVDVAGTRVHILVPIVVVDELDGLKQIKDKQIRWRAGYTLAVLDRLFTRTTGPVRLRAEDLSAIGPTGTGGGEITIELLFDPPGHVRLPINDDEIIDRALAVKPLAARTVTLLTYDTGQAMRARAAGLEVKKLRKEIGEEPTD